MAEGGHGIDLGAMADASGAEDVVKGQAVTKKVTRSKAEIYLVGAPSMNIPGARLPSLRQLLA